VSLGAYSLAVLGVILFAALTGRLPFVLVPLNPPPRLSRARARKRARLLG